MMRTRRSRLSAPTRASNLDADERRYAKKPLPPACFLTAVVLAVGLHFLFPLKQIISMPWRLIGLVPLVVGVVLNLVADRALKEQNTTVKPFEKSRALLTIGVFSFTRNPMYLGMTLILLGMALLQGSAMPFMVVVALPILFNRMFITPEEQMLEARFGDQFRAYRKRVRRWI